MGVSVCCGCDVIEPGGLFRARFSLPTRGRDREFAAAFVIMIIIINSSMRRICAIAYSTVMAPRWIVRGF
jgi:hypothetical protein